MMRRTMLCYLANSNGWQCLISVPERMGVSAHRVFVGTWQNASTIDAVRADIF